MPATASRATRRSTSRPWRNARTTRTNISAPATRKNKQEKRHMMRIQARGIGAMILGAALALPLAGGAQLKAEPARDGTAPPITAHPESKQKPVAPQVAPVPQKGSTAVPGWNNPPPWGDVSESRQYASIPGV